MPAPRSKKPKPFSRPSIDLSTPKEGRREWQHVPVTEIATGDLVADVGRIMEIQSYEHLPNPATRWEVRLIGPEKTESYVWGGHDVPTVFAFTVTRG